MALPKTKTQVSCPVCSAAVVWDETSPWRPFCSERCRLIDLGDWLAENHRISNPIDADNSPLPEEL